MRTHEALRNDIIRIGFAETSTLEKIHDIGFARCAERGRYRVTPSWRT
jgi:hypothetical protein